MMDSPVKPINLRRAVSKKGVDSADKTARTKQNKASSQIEECGQHEDKVRTKCGQKESEAKGLILRLRDKSITSSNSLPSSDPSRPVTVHRVSEPSPAHASALQTDGFKALKSSRPLSPSPVRLARPLGLFPPDRGAVFRAEGSSLAPLPPTVEESKRLADENRVMIAACVIATRRISGVPSMNGGWAKWAFAFALSGYDVEVFAAIFLNAHHVPLHESPIVMNTGTVTTASVYPREVARAALGWNASAVLIAHNHPTGSCEPSEADVRLTMTIRDALRAVDVDLLDHAVVGAGVTFLFATVVPVHELTLAHTPQIKAAARAFMQGENAVAPTPAPQKATRPKRAKPNLRLV